MNNNDKKWHEIHANNIRKRENTRAERLDRRRRGLNRVRSKASQRVHMKVPEYLDLSNNYDTTINFINSINECVFEDGNFAFIDFSACKQISVEACVVLAAEIDRCQRLEKDSVFGAYPNNAEVYFLLNELGFFQLLGIHSSRPHFDDASEFDVVKLRSGKDDPKSLMTGIKELFYPEGQEIPRTPFSGNVYRALTEAMGNSVEHAYPKNFLEHFSEVCLPLWWRAGFKDNQENTVTMVLYDQGAGIPNTLTTNWFEKLNELSSLLSRDPYDDEKIALAMEHGRSRTKTPGRGQGSYDMQTLIRESENAQLSIFSYHGKYNYTNNGDWQNQDLKVPLKGTLVIWKICLNSVKETQK